MAIAVIYSFLSELDAKLSHRIQRMILDKYKATTPPTAKRFNIGKHGIIGMLDSDIILHGDPDTKNVKGLAWLLNAHIISKYWTCLLKTSDAGEDMNPIATPDEQERYVKKVETMLRRDAKQFRFAKSALLFGPPGTSKTEVTKRVAWELGWPLIELDPSHFMMKGHQNIVSQANEIFNDLMDLSGVAILFDEMDALVQGREKHIDLHSQFLTTTMLPKLSKLHDQGQVVFFMATNYQDRFDSAIKRSGRFDLLLCMGPPKILKSEYKVIIEKLLKDLCGIKKEKADTLAEAIEKHLISLKKNKENKKLLHKFQLMTFGELISFLSMIADEPEAAFVEKLKSFCEDIHSTRMNYPY